METINNAASAATSAASRLIWGEGQQAQTTANNETGGVEPISGEQGKGTVEEPFDKGNSVDPIAGKTHPASSNHGPHTTYAGNMLDPQTHQDAHDETFGEGADDRLSRKESSTLAQANPLPSYDGAGNYSKSTSDSYTPSSTNRSTENTATLPDRTRTTHDHLGSTGTNEPYLGSTEPSSTSASTTTPAPNPISAASGGVPRPEHETDKTGVIGNMSSDPKGSDVRPTEAASNTGAAPESGAAPMQKQQGAANPTEQPSGSKSTTNIDDIDGEEALKKRDPNDHSGEPMKMHGETEKKAIKFEDRRESKAGQPGGQEHGKEEHGTGEQWVKTTGMAAEGGNFDATKPGAGREADRLQEQKGIHKATPGETAGETDDSASPSGTKEKVSLSDKLKTKLHIGHKDKS